MSRPSEIPNIAAAFPPLMAIEDVPICVLVQDDVAGSCVGERAGRDGVVALVADLQLNPRARHDARLVEVRAVEIEPDVAEPVDGEHRAVDASRADLRLGNVEPGECIRIDGRAQFGERRHRARGEPRPERRGPGRGTCGRPSRARTPDYASSCASAIPPSFSTARMSRPLSGPDMNAAGSRREREGASRPSDARIDDRKVHSLPA